MRLIKNLAVGIVLASGSPAFAEDLVQFGIDARVSVYFFARNAIIKSSEGVTVSKLVNGSRNKSVVHPRAPDLKDQASNLSAPLINPGVAPRGLLRTDLGRTSSSKSDTDYYRMERRAKQGKESRPGQSDIPASGGRSVQASPRKVTLVPVLTADATSATGPKPKVGEVVWLKYKGKLAADGTMFDESPDIPLPVEGLFPEGTPFPVEEGAIIPGLFQGIQQMRKGGKYTLFIPADLAYGDSPPEGSLIPPNADLEFEIEVIDIMSQATFDRNLQILEQAVQSGQAEP